MGSTSQPSRSATIASPSISSSLAAAGGRSTIDQGSSRAGSGCSGAPVPGSRRWISGSTCLAEAGLLTGHAVTTHWSCLAGFAERFPDLDTREQLFTHDETVITISGGTAGIDLMLHLIAEKHGRQLASEIADQMLHHPIRDATLPQRHTLGGLTSQTHPQVRAAIRLMEANLAEPMSVPRLAKSIGTSQRQLERMFCRYMGCSAVRFNLLLRLQNARVLLTSTRLSFVTSRQLAASIRYLTSRMFFQAVRQAAKRVSPGVARG